MNYKLPFFKEMSAIFDITFFFQEISDTANNLYYGKINKVNNYSIQISDIENHSVTGELVYDTCRNIPGSNKQVDIMKEAMLFTNDEK